MLTVHFGLTEDEAFRVMNPRDGAPLLRFMGQPIQSDMDSWEEWGEEEWYNEDTDEYEGYSEIHMRVETSLPIATVQLIRTHFEGRLLPSSIGDKLIVVSDTDNWSETYGELSVGA